MSKDNLLVLSRQLDFQNDCWFDLKKTLKAVEEEKLTTLTEDELEQLKLSIRELEMDMQETMEKLRKLAKSEIK